MNKRIDISPQDPAAIALETLEKAGWQAWIVGGWVRDALIGRAAHDADIATKASWRAAKAAFEEAGFGVHETGIKHGTITTIVAGEPIEVTTYRTEGPYSDARHPDYIEAAETIEADLARRDFTINAIAWHPARGFADPYDGMGDIGRKLIRCVGRATERFAEDPLRIIRAARFSSQLGFSIEQSTREAAVESARMLSLVAQERIGAEFSKLLMGAHAGQTIEAELEILGVAIPELYPLRGFELKSKRHSYDLLGHLAHSVDAAPADLASRWAALLHDVAKPYANHDHAEKSAVLAREIMHRLRISRKAIDEACDAIAWHMTAFIPSDQAVREFIACLGGDVSRARRILELQRSDALGHGPAGLERAKEVDEELAAVDSLALRGEALKVKDLAIGGSEVLARSDARGAQIAETLDALLAGVFDGEAENEREALIEYLPRARERACNQVFKKRLEKFLTKR